MSEHLSCLRSFLDGEGRNLHCFVGENDRFTRRITAHFHRYGVLFLDSNALAMLHQFGDLIAFSLMNDAPDDDDGGRNREDITSFFSICGGAGFVLSPSSLQLLSDMCESFEIAVRDD